MVVSRACLVACGSEKADGRTIAWQLYQGTLFQKSWTAATLAGQPYVMSAKHELLTPTERLDPYDESLRDVVDEERFHWGRSVVGQLPTHYDELLLLGGRHYVEPVTCAIDDGVYDGDVTVYDPYGWTIGNGQQMKIAQRLSEALLDDTDFETAYDYAVEPYHE